MINYWGILGGGFTIDIWEWALIVNPVGGERIYNWHFRACMNCELWILGEDSQLIFDGVCASWPGFTIDNPGWGFTIDIWGCVWVVNPSLPLTFTTRGPHAIRSVQWVATSQLKGTIIFESKLLHCKHLCFGLSYKNRQTYPTPTKWGPYKYTHNISYRKRNKWDLASTATQTKLCRHPTTFQSWEGRRNCLWTDTVFLNCEKHSWQKQTLGFAINSLEGHYTLSLSPNYQGKKLK